MFVFVLPTGYNVIPFVGDGMK